MGQTARRNPHRWVSSCATAAAVLTAAAALATPARGALPTTYGGRFTVPSLTALRLPDPRTASTALESALARAVYDTLYTSDLSGEPTPSLAAYLPEREESVDGAPPRFRVQLRGDVRRHDRRTLSADDVVQSLRAAARSSAKPWLVGLGPSLAEPDVRAVDPLTLSFAWRGSARALAVRLSALPLSIVHRRGGTGPYRARLRSGELHLSQFRAAARGAPYVRTIVVRPPEDREQELRSFELERADASWRGAALYGQPRRPVQRLDWPDEIPVLLVLGPRAQPHAAALDRAIDRRRLARVGLVPTDALAPGVPTARLTGTAPTGPLRLVVRADDQFQRALASALDARFDEEGWDLEVAALEASRYARALSAGTWDLRVVQAPPALPDPVSRVASVLVAVGDGGGAARVLSEGTAGLAHAGRSLRAILLGRRDLQLHAVGSLRGASFDVLGRLRFERLHVVLDPEEPEE